MSAIYNYIMDMIPFMALSVPIIVVVRAVICARQRKLDIKREILILILVAFSVGLASQTVIPKVEISGGTVRLLKYGRSGINFIPFRIFHDVYMETRSSGSLSFFLVNIVGNITIFMPIGFLIPLIWKSSAKKVILIGCATSLFIEVCQLFLQRGTDIDDVILNTLGTAVGYLIYKAVTTGRAVSRAAGKRPKAE